jgi:hypothetical protein
MTLVIPPDCFEYAWFYTCTGSDQVAVTTMGLRHSVPVTSAALEAAAVTWASVMTRSMADVWLCTHSIIRMQEGAIQEVGHGNAGATAHTAMPSAIAFMLNKHTGLPGRRKKGRVYLPGVSEQDADQNGRMAPSKITELNNNLAEVLTGWSGEGFTPVLLHNASNDPLVDTSPTSITSITCADKVATQRDRMR